MSWKVGIYGGTFDPVHIGHLIHARKMLTHFKLNRIMFMPAKVPPHKQDQKIATLKDRMEMIQKAIKEDDVLENLASVSDVEGMLGSPNYTINTIRYLRENIFRSKDELCLIVGQDTLPQLHTWHKIDELVKEARIISSMSYNWRPSPDFGFSDFIGSDLVHKIGNEKADTLEKDCLITKQIEFHSTEIRERVRLAQSIQYMVPDVVKSYITQHSLYTDGNTTRLFLDQHGIR